MSIILVIDDDPEIRGTFESLSKRMRFDCLSAGTLSEGMALVRSQPVDVVLLDIRLPDGNGLDALPGLRLGDTPPEVIILTGLGDPDGAEMAISGGAWDYLVKPAPIKQTMLSLTRALKYRKEKGQQAAMVSLRRESIIGASARLQACLDLVAQASRLTGPVLITGETGTGKELLARTIHQNSERAPGEFIAVDCASLTETLLESTLFGHRKGAFTGADQDRPGLVKLADGGTLFLDEVGELPMSIQKAFLRVLQEKRFRPVGASLEVTSDFRLLAATNRDLEAMAARGEFRQDLLYRLKTFVIALPPLRERKEDLKPLTLAHLDELCQRYSMPSKGLGADLQDMLAAYSWPGNVRELFGVLERALAAAGTEPTLYAKHLPTEVRIQVMKASIERGRKAETQEAHPAFRPEQTSCGGMLSTLKAFKDAKEREYLDTLLFNTGKDLQCMLDISGLSRSHLYALLKKHGMTL